MKKKIIKAVIIIALCVLAECIISNYNAISLKISGAEEYAVDLFEENVECSGKKAVKKKDGITVKDGKIKITDVDKEMKNICLILTGEFYEYVDVEISYLDENFAYSDGYEYNRSYLKAFSGIDEKNCYHIESFGKVKDIEINIKDSDGTLTVSKILLNSPPNFQFRIFRFLFFVIVFSSIAFGIWKAELEKHDYTLLKLFALLMCVMVSSTVLQLYNKDNMDLLRRCPSDDYMIEDQYGQLFESINSGRLDLPLDIDTAKLEKLNNPYDRSERINKDVTGDFWDRAYYNGKFYSYFGISPIYTVYYPVYIMTGKMPSAEFASVLLCLYAVIFISLLYIQFIRRFCKNVPIVLALLGQLALLFGSGIFAVAFEAKFYYIAVLSGITWTAAFLYFLLTAYYEEVFVKRIIYLVMSGISIVLIAASRPTLLLYCAAAIVPAIFIMTRKQEKIKSKIIYVVSIGTPLVMGAVMLMIYNYKRFDNPFEFGFNYQLTVSIAKANTFSLSMIPATIFHYFIQQPNINTNFPFIEIKSRTLDTYHRYNYNGRTMGILNYPIAWGLFLTPVFIRKRDKFKTAFMVTFAAAALLMAFIDMCKAGSHYRYTIDILMPIILAATVAVFDCLSVLKGISKKAYILFYVFVSAMMVITICVGFFMMFANEKGRLIDDFTLTCRLLQSL